LDDVGTLAFTGEAVALVLARISLDDVGTLAFTGEGAALVLAAAFLSEDDGVK